MAPASFQQYVKLHNNLGGPATEELQPLIESSDLLTLMMKAGSRLSQVDRAAFAALLAPAPASILWTPVGEYAERIAARNRLRGWGLTDRQIDEFADSLVDHTGSHLPTGITMWLGNDLHYNWVEATAWLRDEVAALGRKFTPYLTPNRLSFHPGSEQRGKRKLLTPALLDIGTYWDPTNGVVPNQVRRQELKLPGLEVPWTLALNPQVYLAIDYKSMPGLIAAGLVVDSDSVPSFGCGSVVAFVHGGWAGSRWGGGSVVRFRKR